jgi:DNA-binding response OmpR family regulator
MVLLVVDGDPADRAFILQTLADEGHSAVAVTNGSEALLTMEHTRPEVVLLSLTLPDLDGPVVRERIRSLPGFAATPVLFLVTMQDVENSSFGLAMGDDFITKPLRPAELLLRLHSMLLQLDRRQVLVDLLTRQQLDALKHTAGIMVSRAQEILQYERISSEVRYTASSILVDSHSRELLRFTLNLLEAEARQRDADAGVLDLADPGRRSARRPAA